MHDIEELERQFQAANNRAIETNKMAREARDRLTNAKLDATGLIGHVVSYERNGQTFKFVAKAFPRWGGELSLRGPKIKKDGHLSERDDDARITELTDHGPYQEPK